MNFYLYKKVFECKMTYVLLIDQFLFYLCKIIYMNILFLISIQLMIKEILINPRYLIGHNFLKKTTSEELHSKHKQIKSLNSVIVFLNPKFIGVSVSSYLFD